MVVPNIVGEWTLSVPEAYRFSVPVEGSPEGATLTTPAWNVRRLGARPVRDHEQLVVALGGHTDLLEPWEERHRRIGHEGFGLALVGGEVGVVRLDDDLVERPDDLEPDTDVDRQSDGLGRIR